MKIFLSLYSKKIYSVNEYIIVLSIEYKNLKANKEYIIDYHMIIEYDINAWKKY